MGATKEQITIVPDFMIWKMFDQLLDLMLIKATLNTQVLVFKMDARVTNGLCQWHVEIA